MTVVGFCILFSLGTWQIKRLTWKEALVKEISERAKLPSLNAQDMEKLTSSTLVFRVVELKGHFLHAYEMHLQSRLYQGQIGYHLVTPFETKSGSLLMIDRGWVPLHEHPAIERPLGEVSLKGLVRLPEKPSMFTPSNQYDQNHLYWISPSEIAEKKYLKNVLPIYLIQIGQNENGYYPKISNGSFSLRNLHLSYAITWYSLSIILLIIYGVYIFKKMRYTHRA
jgi:surfeit locus 1 family protein